MEKLSAVKYKKPKPTLSVDESHLPAIKDWVVGKTYTVTCRVKMTFQSEGNEYDYGMETGGEEKKPEMRARFRILDITPEKEMPKKRSKKYPRSSSK